MAGKDQVSQQQAVIRHAQDDMANLPPERAQAEAKQPEKSKHGAPSTASVLCAEWRRGLKDLQNFVLNPWQGHVAQHEDPGTIANPTNLEVYQDRHEEPAGNDNRNYEQTLADSAQRVPSQQQERGRSR